MAQAASERGNVDTVHRIDRYSVHRRVLSVSLTPTLTGLGLLRAVGLVIRLGNRIVLMACAKTKSGGIARIEFPIEFPDRAHPNKNRGSEI